MSELADVDILKADDATLRVLAAEAMGWECIAMGKYHYPVGVQPQTKNKQASSGTWKIPNAPGCLDDAVALAEHWRKDKPDYEYTLVQAPWGTRALVLNPDFQPFSVDGEPFACALTRAVLLALQAAERQEQTA